MPAHSIARPGLKPGYFVLEGLNSFGTVYFFYYFYFFMQQVYGFGNRSNLVLAALNAGAIYAVGAWQAGKFAQRFGYFNALKVGFLTMMTATALGLQMRSAAGHIFVMAIVVVGMCFTWPTLEALVSEGETPGGLQKMLGIYNIVWAATAAAANFTGGAMLEKLGFRSLFYVPMAIQMTQLSLTLWLEWSHRALPQPSSGPREPAMESPHFESRVPTPRSPARAEATTVAVEAREPRVGTTPPPAGRGQCFLRMAWLANPFAYIAINTLIPVIPGVAAKLHLSTMLAGFCCSVWCFARVGAFIGLWMWNGWHYRFRWLLAAFVALVASFAAILTATTLAMLVLAQILFGAALGLIYYSSLFYSMDASETKGEHGGIHEAVIGLGNFAGPAVGAVSLYFLPEYGNSSTFGVTLLLLCGLGGLLALWRKGTKATIGE
jgi:predicted MFS family arabinose efflux permease